MRKGLRILKQVAGMILSMTLVLSCFPATSMALESGVTETTVTNETEFKAALNNADVDIITIDGLVELLTSASTDDAFVIPRDVTIQGGTLSLRPSGIVLGGAVTFKNIEICFTSAVRNAIIANGYPLVLENVSNGSTAFSIHLFCGGITDYTGGNGSEIPAAGADGHITIKGTNELGNIYAGSLSDVGSGVPDEANSYAGKAAVTIENEASGFGEIYAHGARENREGGSPDALLPSADLYTVTGGVEINLNYNATITVHGATGGSTDAVLNYTDNGNGYQCLPLLESMGGIKLNPYSSGVKANLAPASGSSFSSKGAVLSVPDSTRLDLTDMASQVTAASLTGGGELVLGENQVLNITGAVSGTTKVAVGDVSYDGLNSTASIAAGQTYIKAANAAENSFLLLPHSLNTNMILSKDENGSWMAVSSTGSIFVNSITMSDFAVTDGNSIVEIPVEAAYSPADEWLSSVPIIVSVNGTEASIESGALGYYYTCDIISGLEMSFYVDDNGSDVFSMESDAAAFPTGTYELSFTVPAEYMASGQAYTFAMTLTVCDHANTTTSWTDNGDGTHSEKYECCGMVVSTAEHTFATTGVCSSCNAVASLAVTDAASAVSYHDTFDSAIAAAGNNGTIRIVNDITIGEEETVTIPEGVTLDLQNMGENVNFQVDGQLIVNGTLLCNHNWTYVQNESTSAGSSSITGICGICKQENIITLTAPAGAGDTGIIYDGMQHEAIAVQSLGVLQDVPITYSYKDWNDIDAADHNYTRAGKYKASITIGGQTAEVEWVINKAGLTVSGVTASNRVYDGTNAVQITDVVVNGKIGNDEVSVDASNLTGTLAGADAGTYTKVKLPALMLIGSSSDNYELLTAEGAEAGTNVVIEPRDITNAEITLGDTLTYNGSEQEQTIASVTSSGLSVTYELSNHTGINAGSYTLTVTGTGNFKGTATKQFTIQKAKPEGVPKYNTITESGKTLADAGLTTDGSSFNIEGSVEWESLNTTIVEIGKEYTWIFTPNDIQNYETVTGTIIPFQKQSVEITATDAEIVYDRTYDVTKLFAIDENAGAAAYSIVEGSENAALDGTILTIHKTGTVKIEVVTAENDSYLAGAAAAQLTVKPKTLSVEVNVNKQYDGLNTGVITGAELTGVVAGDEAAVDYSGVTVTFSSVNAAEKIDVIYTGAFKLTGEDADNYILTQPAGITGSITNNWNPKENTEYTISGRKTDGWVEKEFVITAKEGYKLSLTNTAEGSWADSIARSEATENGSVVFYLKNIATGAISNAVTENYKIASDKTDSSTGNNQGSTGNNQGSSSNNQSGGLAGNNQSSTSTGTALPDSSAGSSQSGSNTNTSQSNGSTAAEKYSIYIIDSTKENENVGKAKLEDSRKELTDKIPLTQKERNEIAQGKTIEVYLKVADISETVSETDKKLIEEKLEDAKVGMYLDLSVYKQIGEKEPQLVANTNSPLTITIGVPENLLNVNPFVQRTYQIIRVHNGEAAVIIPIFNEVLKTLTFETDLFSTYALVYTDVEMETSENGMENTESEAGTPEDETEVDGAESEIQKLKGIQIAGLLIGIIIVGIVVYFFKKKKSA